MLVSDTYRTVPFYAETERWNAWGILFAVLGGPSAHMIDSCRRTRCSAYLCTSVGP